MNVLCSLSPLLAQTRVIYEWLRIEQLDQWWHWLLLGLVCFAVLLHVLYWYRRDSVEHFRPVGWSLGLLRVAALIGLLLYFLQLEKHTEQKIVRDSKVAILVDTSMSMSLAGTPSDVGLASPLTRGEEAVRLIGQSEFLERLARQHQVSVYRFDQLSRPTSVAALQKTSNTFDSQSPEQFTADTARALRWGRGCVLMAAVVGGIGLSLLIVSWSAQIFGFKDWIAGSWSLLLGSMLLLCGLVVGGFGVVPHTQFSLPVLLALEDSALAVPAESDANESKAVTLPDDWADTLAPRGTETRMGDAIKSMIERETSNPLAGIVLLTDGRNNAGLDPREIVSMTQAANVPLYIIGLGSEKSPDNLQLVEMDVPKRLYPGDRFSLRALVGAQGFAGRMVTVQVLAGGPQAELDQMGLEAEQQVLIPADGSLAQAEFQLEPKSVGKWRYAVNLLPLAGDANAGDNSQMALVEVIERKNRVLILAGGPTREYQFVRNLLYRDRDVESHVLLQTGTELTSQEAQQLLSEFPPGLAELSAYDAIIAFDPDWTRIPERSLQALERWVGEQAGGFLMVAGSVEMPKWLARSASGLRSQILRSLSPVTLEKQGSALLATGRIESETAWPLTVTADGRQADFLWLTDDAQGSLDLWSSFGGVYSFYSAYELKPGAKALVRFSDPSAAIDGQLPIYMASQYYGAGRTLFIGGGELWRLRSLGDQYFDRLYTKLVRWVSQGRLLLDSDRGVLLVDREQALLGDPIVVRAVLKDERFEPLIQSEVVARLVDPQELNTPLTLRPLADGSQPGVYTGQFPILRPGEYNVQLQLGGLASDELLTATVKAKVPALEMQRAERNDALLRQMAVESGGKYWSGVANAVVPTEAGGADIIESIEPKDQTAFLPGTPDQEFQLRWLGWLMVFIAGCLSIEWLTRRLHRLA